MAPLPMEFHGSSLPLNPIRQQSKVENKPPHTAKLPAVTNTKIEGIHYVCKQRSTDHATKLCYYSLTSPGEEN